MAQRHARLLAHPIEPEVTLLGALGAHKQRKAARIFECVVFTGRFRLANGGIGQGHEYISRLVRLRRCVPTPARGAPPTNRSACYPDFMHLKMYLKFVAGAGF